LPATLVFLGEAKRDTRALHAEHPAIPASAAVTQDGFHTPGQEPRQDARPNQLPDNRSARRRKKFSRATDSMPRRAFHWQPATNGRLAKAASARPRTRLEKFLAGSVKAILP